MSETELTRDDLPGLRAKLEVTQAKAHDGSVTEGTRRKYRRQSEALAETIARISGTSWRDFMDSLPEGQRECFKLGHCDHDAHPTCCWCGYVTKECADPECDALAYLGSDYCLRHA